MNSNIEHIVAADLQLPQMSSWPADLPHKSSSFPLRSRQGAFTLTPQRLRAIAGDHPVLSLTGHEGRVLLVGGDIPGAYKISLAKTAHIALAHLGITDSPVSSTVRGELSIGEGFGVLELRRPHRRGRKTNAARLALAAQKLSEGSVDLNETASASPDKTPNNPGIRRKAGIIPSSKPLPFYGTPLAWTDVFVPLELTPYVLGKSLPPALLSAAGLTRGSLLECQFDGEALSFTPALESSRTAWRIGHRGPLATHFQIYEAIAKLAERTHAEIVRVIAVAGGLYVTPVGSRVATLCLPRKKVASDLVPTFKRKADEPDFSIGGGGADNQAPRLRGHWLRNLGFYPGTAFDVVPHPQFPNKALFEPTSAGPFAVADAGARVPEVVCPPEILAKFPTKFVRLAIKDGELIAQSHMTGPLPAKA